MKTKQLQKNEIFFYLWVMSASRWLAGYVLCGRALLSIVLLQTVVLHQAGHALVTLLLWYKKRYNRFIQRQMAQRLDSPVPSKGNKHLIFLATVHTRHHIQVRNKWFKVMPVVTTCMTQRHKAVTCSPATRQWINLPMLDFNTIFIYQQNI